MEDDKWIGICAVLAITLAIMQAKRIDRLERDVRSLANGDADIVKMRRKLEGDPGE